MKICVLGNGRQGSIIAQDLKRRGYDVRTADLKNADVKVDLSDFNNLYSIAGSYDLLVGALPSVLGRNAMRAAIKAGADYVDVSFMASDPSIFNDAAQEQGITVLYDCGLAPGLSHLIAGRAISKGAQNIDIMVGGIAPTPEEDYVITWSPADLYEEYTRPTRLVRDGAVIQVPALSGAVEVDLYGLILSAFYTDGLRSLLRKSGKVSNMSERTIRWPGHLARVNGLLDAKDWVGGLRALYQEHSNDMVLMRIQADDQITTMRVMGDNEMSAMARTTALSCSAFVQLLAEGIYSEAGVISPEDVGMNKTAYDFVISRLAEKGVLLELCIKPR